MNSRAKEDPISSPKRLARIAGVLYLLVGISGGFAQGFVYPKIYAAGDATTTAGNLVANSGLVRIGVIADLLDQTLWVFLAMILYRLLRQVHQSASFTMVVLVALGAGIACLNAVFEFEGMRVATGAVSLAVGAGGTNALALLMVDAQHYGLLIDTVFQGLWLMPLGYLAYKSGLFPKALGVLLVVGGVCYLLDVFAQFLAPDFGPRIATVVVIPSAIAEISMVIYLLVIGVKTPKPVESILAAA
ncbi:MAG: DUF4386 domain-containing protein [Candidatus Dormibacteraeota bacterium]|nr:DUF4386 domain-containing protein [Candidatus Dormibacteraeota bacterium]